MILLGSTGSIGVNTLEIAKRFNLHVDVLVAGNNTALLNRQIQEHKPRIVVVANEDAAKSVVHPHVLWGEESIESVVRESESRFVVNALVGFLGLKPTVAALESGKKVALANKESLVTAGAFLDRSQIIPIDSEHFGLWYLMRTGTKAASMTITASGGAFRDWPLEKLAKATLADTQKHPNWSMGQKITIDSATMVNKLFELLEARWLFGEGRYDAVIETKSIIHALVNFQDGSTTAHLAHADMKLPIAYALLGNVEEPILSPVDLVQVGSLEFRAIDPKRYLVWEIKEALLERPKLGVVVNAANEVAIERFIEKKIGFLDISRLIIETFIRYRDISIESIEDVFAVDEEIRITL